MNSIRTGDVLKQLAKLTDDTIDLTVTSPPYNKRNKANGWLVTNEMYSHYDDHMAEEQYQNWQVNVLNELFRVTKPGGSLFYNHKIRWEDGVLIHPLTWIAKSHWVIRQEIVWDRGLAANMRGWRFWQVDERVYWLYKKKDKHTVGAEIESRHAKLSSIWRIKPAPRSDDHPAAFPIEIPARAIYSMPSPGRLTVLDPFCGTGTTLVAAKLLGHDYIGFDLSPEYAKIARARVRNSASERAIVDAEVERHVIEVSFAERKEKGTTNWPYGPKPTDETDRIPNV